MHNKQMTHINKLQMSLFFVHIRIVLEIYMAIVTVPTVFHLCVVIVSKWHMEANTVCTAQVLLSINNRSFFVTAHFQGNTTNHQRKVDM